jgi:DNA-binding MarR family transcriptional regulator
MPQGKRPPIMEAIGMAFLTWKRHAQKEIQPYGVTLKQFQVLRQLGEKGTLYPAEIADMLFCDRPTATVVIKNMEKQGWVKRELDPNDLRRFKVTLESAGQGKLKEIPWDRPDYKKRRFKPTACFTSQEKMQFKKLLAKLNEHFEQLKEGTNVSGINS